MMNRFSTVLVLSTLASLFTSASAQYYQCSLCGNPSQYPLQDRLQYQFANGLTCTNYWGQAAAYKSYDAQCTNIRAVAQATCCNAATPAVPSAAQAATPGVYTGQTGSSPLCNICKDGGYPGNPSGFIVARYVGEYTCDQFYGRGRHGMIPLNMCGPLQDFAQTVCQCGAYNPNSNANANAQSSVSYSLTSSSSNARTTTYSGTPGARNLRGSADSKDESEKVLAPEDYHFETRELPADFFSSETTSEVSEAEVEENQAVEASEPVAETQEVEASELSAETQEVQQ